MPEMIDQRLTPIKTRLDDIGKDLHNFTIEIRHDELSKMVSELRNRIQEPFMFVIVGEVKAGKSSFINALLDTGKEICAVAPSPMTDTVQQIIYGTEKEEQQLNPYLKRIYLPVEILKEIAIVDTPGTNTIIDHHQEITERFIPASDLIVFVFEAKNPYRESAWKFFEFIHDDWRKKIVFILQQKDLLPENELEINKKGLIEQAGKKGMKRPLVFTVSAKDELEGRKDISGFAAVRDYIKENITGGQAPWLKLKNNITTFENILDRIAKGLDDREAQYKADVQFREEVKSTLDEQESISVGQVKHMVSSLLASYDAVTVKKEMEISSSLSMFSLIKRSFRSIFSKQQSLKVYLETLAASLGEEMNKELRKRLDENIADLAQSIQNMVQIVDLKIRNSENILTNDHDLFSNIAERRNNVLKDLQETFGKFLQETENFASKELFPEGTALSPNVLTGSGMAVIRSDTHSGYARYGI